MIVAIEGLDGTGKTTISGHLGGVLQRSELLHTPPRSYYDGNFELLRNLNSTSRAILFVAGLLATNDRLVRLAKNRKVAIVDKFTGSVAGMNRFLKPELDHCCRDLHVLTPDLTIELTCDEETRSARLTKRGKPLDPFEEALAADADLRGVMRQSMRDCAGDYVSIDTSKLSRGLVTEVCLYHIERSLPLPREEYQMDDASVYSVANRLRASGIEDWKSVAILEGTSTPEDTPPPRAKSLESWLEQRNPLNQHQRSADQSPSQTGDGRDNPNQFSISITNSTIVDSVMPVAVGGERNTASAGDRITGGEGISPADVLALARSEVERYFAVVEQAPDNGDREEADEAMQTLEDAFEGAPYSSRRLNNALNTLQPILFSVACSATGSAIYEKLAILVAQIV